MLLLATIDDISGIVVPHAIDRLMEVGAHSVHVSQTVTKKGRVGLLFIVDVSEEDGEAVGEAVMTELGSLGYNIVRTEHVHSTNSSARHRVVVKSPRGERSYHVEVKSSASNGRRIKSEPEAGDLSRIINEVKKDFDRVVPMRDLINEIRSDIEGGEDTTYLLID